MTGQSKKLIFQGKAFNAVRRIHHVFLERYEDGRANYWLKKQKKKNTGEPIHVAFIVQMPEIWDKEEPVYSAMSVDPRFSVSMLVVPAYNQIHKTIETEYGDNYFLNMYPEAIRTYENGRWQALGKEYDYVFYQRPYDQFLPIGLQSRNVVKLAKCCYIPYGYTGADVFNEGSTNKEFFRNLYFGFAESAYMARVFERRYQGKKGRELHKIAFLGFPSLVPYFDLKPTNEYRRILWTPRWSYAPKAGGSHFLEYKDSILNLKNQSPELTLTFRPHPLLFGELISTSRMSDREIEDYLKQLSQNNIAYDNGHPIYETIQNTDILITDYSSIIIQFFITGKPIVFCESDIVLYDDFKMLSDGMYVVHNEEELITTVQMLVEGEDPLYMKRQKIIDRLSEEHKDATDNIIETIYKDYCDCC